jgi:hypothetical protein
MDYQCQYKNCTTRTEKTDAYCGYHQRERAEAAEKRVKELEAARAMLNVYDRSGVIGTIGYDVCMKMREALK